MHQSFDITTIVFALLAVFVVWKLRSVLGTRTGQERPPYDPFAARRKARDGSANPPGETGTVIRLPGTVDTSVELQPAAVREQWSDFIEPESRAAAGLDDIRSKDPAFSAKAFVDGARAAYEMIVTAFAAGDRTVLQPLLAKDVFESFSAAITAREQRGHKVETTFVSLGKVLIADAQMRGRTAQISTKFNSQMITVTRDRDGAVVDGSTDQVADVSDLWTFARDTDSRDPNWMLVATETLS